MGLSTAWARAIVHAAVAPFSLRRGWGGWRGGIRRKKGGGVVRPAMTSHVSMTLVLPPTPDALTGVTSRRRHLPMSFLVAT
jgi:hypothetical protein